MDDSREASWREFYLALWRHLEAVVAGLSALFLTAFLAWFLGVDALPTRAVFVLFSLSAIWAAFLCFHDVRLERDRLAVKHGPDIRPIKPKATPLFKRMTDTNTGQLIAQYEFRAVQARFQNASEALSDDITARRLSARLSFFRDGEEDKAPIVSVYGLWIVKAAAPDNAAGDQSPEIDIPGNDLPLRLWVAQRPQGLRDAYAYCAENMQAPHFGRLDAYKLGEGRFRVRAALRSAKFKREYWFTLVNDPNQDALVLTADGAEVEFLFMQ